MAGSSSAPPNLYTDDDSDYEDRGRADVRPSESPEKTTARFKTGRKLYMKDSDGQWTILVWVKSQSYNDEREGWDYEVCQKDRSHREWVGNSYWRQERELKKA